jgi:hypothetical protein
MGRKCCGKPGPSCRTNSIQVRTAKNIPRRSPPKVWWIGSQLRVSTSASQPLRSVSAGMLDRYGLMSSMGVPSSMSTPRTCSAPCSRRSNVTTVRPMGFGRRGDRVANTPCGLSSKGGVPIKSKLWARWNSQITNRCEKPSMSVSPISNSGKILSSPSASCLACGPLGISVVIWYGLLTKPIGCETNIYTGAFRPHHSRAAPVDGARGS